jgi:hypothetical protein
MCYAALRRSANPAEYVIVVAYQYWLLAYNLSASASRRNGRSTPNAAGERHRRHQVLTG